MFAAFIGMIFVVSASVAYGVFAYVFPIFEQEQSLQQTAIVQTVSSSSAEKKGDTNAILGIVDEDVFLSPTVTPIVSIGSSGDDLHQLAQELRLPTKQPTLPPVPTVVPSVVPTRPATPTIKPTKIPLPTLTLTPFPTLSLTPPADGLRAETIFTLINDFRSSNNLPAFKKDATVCSIAQLRATQIYDEIFVTYNFHAGLKAMALPYWTMENIIYYNTEQGAVDWWLNESTHRQAILGDYTYSCVGCYGYSCSQIFTNYFPK